MLLMAKLDAQNKKIADQIFDLYYKDLN